MDCSPSRKAASSSSHAVTPTGGGGGGGGGGVSENPTPNPNPNLPSDIISNILLRLPVKSLGKFKAVSKQWLAAITDPHFIRTRRERSLQNPNLLLLRTSYEDRDVEPGKPFHHTKKTMVDICAQSFDGKHNAEFKIEVDDIIELLPSKWDLICFIGETGFYACNPSTQQLVKLPEASCCTSGDINAGMGYISSRNEFVLIHLFDRCLDFSVEYDIGCEIMRFTDGCVTNASWKVVEASCPYVVRGWGVLVENVFYWMIWDPYDHPGLDAIVSFDLESEEFGTVEPPKGCLDPNGDWSLVELTGLLCLIDCTSKPSTMDIWVLKDYENHVWVKKHSIDLSRFEDELCKFIIPLDQQDEEILIDSKQDSIEYYNLENKSFNRMHKLSDGEWTWIRLYTESFFSLQAP
ncbi:F-box protein CPR1-like [Diospyros lotus]|uniref:F-box protein CPR1-like n=1 Tax=Diospyros lotus TaxID=55363 RepID=UPI002256FF10|nr:F-box protein CPR1-like [Diospyros lotus]